MFPWDLLVQMQPARKQLVRARWCAQCLLQEKSLFRGADLGSRGCCESIPDLGLLILPAEPWAQCRGAPSVPPPGDPFPAQPLSLPADGQLSIQLHLLMVGGMAWALGSGEGGSSAGLGGLCPGTQITQTNRGGASVPTENCNFRGLLGVTPTSVALQWLPFFHRVHKSRSQQYVKELLFQMGKYPFHA